MAKAWITDLWVKDAIAVMPDGSRTRLQPTAAQLRAIKSLPEHFRAAKYGKGKRWRVTWFADNGDRARKTQHFSTKIEAEAFAAELEDDIRMGRYIDPAHRQKPFAEAAEAWLNSKQRIKDSTYRRYRRELNNYVLPKWGGVPIGEIATGAIREWVTELRAGSAPFEFSALNNVNNDRKRPGAMKASYLRHIVGITFGSVLRFCVASEWLAKTPLAGVELPRDAGNLEEDLPALEYEEVEELAEAVLQISGRFSDRVLLHVLAYTGPRIGEASALKVKDLDLVGQRARIHRTWTVDRDGNRVLGAVKNWQKRWLPLPSFLVEEISSLVVGYGPDDFVFQAPRGGPIDGGNWYSRVWVKARRMVPAAVSMSVHDLRHVAATLAIGAGADVKLVQQMLGHKDATETLNTYAHLWPSRVGEVTELISVRRDAVLASGGLRAVG